MRRTGWRVTPANCVPTLVALVLATIVGWHGGDASGAWRTHATAGPAGVRAVSATPWAAGATPWAAGAPGSPRLAPARPALPAPAGPGTALSAGAFQLTVGQLGRPAPQLAGHRPASTDFPSFRSRAPPRTSW